MAVDPVAMCCAASLAEMPYLAALLPAHIPTANAVVVASVVTAHVPVSPAVAAIVAPTVAAAGNFFTWV